MITTTSFLWSMMQLWYINVSKVCHLQSQTKIVGTVNAKAVFSLPVLSFSLPMLFIAIQSANRVHQHWREENTQQRPNNFDWDCSYLSDKFSTWAIVHDRQTRYRDSLNIPSCRINAGHNALFITLVWKYGII